MNEVYIVPNTITITLILGFSGGQAYKRHDFVEFPETLDMERFTHASQTAQQKNLERFMLGFTNLGSQEIKVSITTLVCCLLSMQVLIVRHSINTV